MNKGRGKNKIPHLAGLLLRLLCCDETHISRYACFIAPRIRKQNPSPSGIVYFFHGPKSCPKFFISLFFTFFFLLCNYPQVIFAQIPIQLNADTQLDYATHCFEHQDYKSAVSEYKKFIYFFKDDERVPAAEYKIGMSYFHDKAYNKALNHFTYIFDQKGPTASGLLSAFMITRCYQRLRDYPAAIENLLYLKQVTADADLADTIYFQLGWLYLESGDFILSHTAFSSISITSESIYNTIELNSDLSAYDEIPQKNPITAGILSVIPGGGYLYCGRYRDALTAFLVNSALIYGAYECFDEDLYAVGGIMAALELGFYAGNIYGGVSSAHKYNLRKQNEFVQGLKKKFAPDFYPALKPDLSLYIQSDDILLGMTYHF